MDFEFSDPQRCQQPGNCTEDGLQLYQFLHVVVPAMHAEGLEVSLDYSLGDQVKSLGSYAGVAATGLDQVMSMDSCKGDREHLALFAARHRHLLLSRRALRPVVLRSEI